MKTLKIKTGEDLKKFRRSLKLNQKEFAERIGFTAIYVNYIERGKRPVTKTVLTACRLIQFEDAEKKIARR